MAERESKVGMNEHVMYFMCLYEHSYMHKLQTLLTKCFIGKASGICQWTVCHNILDIKCSVGFSQCFGSCPDLYSDILCSAAECLQGRWPYCSILAASKCTCE